MDVGESIETAERARAVAEAATESRLELLTALVLASAGLASAWASFQGGLWDKREAEYYARTNSALTESSQLFLRSGQEQGTSAALFLQWLDASANGQTLRADVIANHMPPWFAGEFARWRKALPTDLSTLRPNSPLPAFEGPSLARSQQMQARAEAARVEAERAGRTGDGYDVSNVILATALFLAGIASILHRPTARRLVVLLGGVLALGAIVAMVMMPALAPG